MAGRVERAVQRRRAAVDEVAAVAVCRHRRRARDRVVYTTDRPTDDSDTVHAKKRFLTFFFNFGHVFLRF